MTPKYAHAAEYQYRNNGATTSKRVQLWTCKVLSGFCMRGETAVEIHRQISAVYGEECMSKSMVPHKHFTGKRFNTIEEIKAAVMEYFQNFDAEYYRAGLQKLHKRYTKCLDLQGDYVKK